MSNEVTKTMPELLDEWDNYEEPEDKFVTDEGWNIAYNDNYD